MATCCDVWRIEVVGLWIDWDNFGWWRIFDKFCRIVEGKWSLLNDHKIILDIRSDLGFKLSWWPYIFEIGWPYLLGSSEGCSLFFDFVLCLLKGSIDSRQLINFVEVGVSRSPGHSVLLIFNYIIFWYSTQ